MKLIPISSLTLLAIAAGSLNATLIVHEDFAYDVGNGGGITGNTTGTGLSGTWSGSGSWVDQNSSTSYGSLQTSGGSAYSGTGWAAVTADVDTTSGNVLGNAGLLANGGELWFSMTIDVIAANSDHRFFFALTDGFTSGTTAGNGSITGNAGIGFGLAGNEIFYGNVWDDAEAGGWGNNLTGAPTGNLTTTTGTGTTGTATYFVVGHAQWGATATDNDLVTLYLPGTNLALGTAVSTSQGIIADQSGFDQIGFSNLRADITVDEIRIGASYADVSPVPEPSSFALLAGCFGLTWVMLRRRG